jgi:hypothetical protein
VSIVEPPSKPAACGHSFACATALHHRACVDLAHLMSQRRRHSARVDTLYLWRWWLPDLKGNLKPSRWRMTEDDAQARYPGCTRVEVLQTLPLPAFR